MSRFCILAGAFALIAGAAQAHVVAEPREAPAGTLQAIRFRIGHGCHDTAATTALRIELPVGVKSARPQPKPGWDLSIEHSPGGSVTAVVWRGQLPADQFDDFALLLGLPDIHGPLYFPTIQTCGSVEQRWVQVPSAAGVKLDHPAAVLMLTAPITSDETHHH